MTGMYANQAGIVCAGCDCDGPRAYGNMLEGAKEKAAESRGMRAGVGRLRRVAVHRACEAGGGDY